MGVRERRWIVQIGIFGGSQEAVNLGKRDEDKWRSKEKMLL